MVSLILIEKDKKERFLLQNKLALHKDLQLKEVGKDLNNAIWLTDSIKPDIMLIYVKQGYKETIDISHLAKLASQHTSVVLLYARADEALIRENLLENTAGILLESSDMDHLSEILTRVKAGEHYINPTIGAYFYRALISVLKKNSSGAPVVKKQNESVKADFPVASLSKNEFAILTHIAKGRSGKEIAERMGLKPGTIRNYVVTIKRKMGLKTLAHLINYSITHDLNRKRPRLPDLH
ncbi:MAG: LuxR C-terminal-related transcriptional regulator [Treponema sp.]|nr:LuxR C-terminal-related transcriptional regulator [Treponema sp.]